MSLSLSFLLVPLLSSVVLFITASYAIHRKYRSHRLSIRHISPTTLTLRGVQYEGTIYAGTYAFKFTSSAISIRFHLPTPSRPRWFTFAARDMMFTSTTCDISASTLDTTLWLFPLLLRQTAGTWASVVLDGFRIRVHKSSETPLYVKMLRKNLVNAVLTGEILRVDDFRTSVRFAGFSETFEQQQSDVREDGSADTLPNSEEACTSLSAQERAQRAERVCAEVDSTDEMRVSAFARQLHIHNSDGRMYTFGAVDAQLRRDWNTDRGSFVMVAEEGRWVRVHWAYQRQATGWWAQLVTSVVQFPLDVHRAITRPMSVVDLYVPRTDITFDEFRIRDAELILQTLSLIREKAYASGIQWSDFFLDAVAGMLAPR